MSLFIFINGKPKNGEQVFQWLKVKRKDYCQICSHPAIYRPYLPTMLQVAVIEQSLKIEDVEAFRLCGSCLRTNLYLTIRVSKVFFVPLPLSELETEPLLLPPKVSRPS